MRWTWATGVFLMIAGSCLAAEPVVLATGSTVTLRVRRVLPCDGLSRGERLLNSLPPLKPGDTFTAELLNPQTKTPVIVAGSVASITPPGRFGKPGKVTIQLAHHLGSADGRTSPWWLVVEDQRFTSAQRRRLITSLFMLEGFGLGASIGAQLDRGRAETTLASGAVGVLLGVAYASFQPGQAASLEPGDTFEVVVGTTCVKKLPPELPLTIYPAREPEEERRHKMDKSP